MVLARLGAVEEGQYERLMRESVWYIDAADESAARQKVANRGRWMPPLNLLTDNQASIETDATGWTALLNCAITSSTAQSWTGGASLALTSSAAGNMNARTPAGVSGVPVTGGRTYTTSGYVRAATAARLSYVYVRWYDAAGTFLGENYSAGKTTTTTGWTQDSVTVAAPATAAFAAIFCEVNGTVAAGEVHYFDGIGLWEGSATGPWSLPSYTPATLDAQSGSVYSGVRIEDDHIYLPGVSGNYVNTPDAPALDFTGDIDLRVKVALDSWAPAATQTLVAKFGASGQRSWKMHVNVDGSLGFTFTTDGATGQNRSSVTPTGFVDGTAHWVRFTMDVDNGNGQNYYEFLTSEDGETWTVLGNGTSAGTVAMFASTVQLEIGSRGGTGTADLAAGGFYRVIVKNGIDGVTAIDVDCADAVVGQSQFAASTDATVTVVPGGLSLPGVNGNGLSVLDAATWSSTDFDLRFYLTSGWADNGTTQGLFRHYGDPDRWASIYSPGLFRFRQGTTDYDSTVNVPNGVLGLRVTFDADTGAGQCAVKFWTWDGNTWSQLGSTVTGATPAAAESAYPLWLGCGLNATSVMQNGLARITWATVIDGTPELDIDCSVVTALPGTVPAFTAVTGQTVLVNRYAPVATITDKSVGADNPKHLAYTGTPYVYLPNYAQNVTTVPHVAGEQVGDTLDLRIDLTRDDWSVACGLMGKGASTASPGTFAYSFAVASSGRLNCAVSDGTLTIGHIQTVLSGTVINGARTRLRLTYVRDTGGGQYAVAYWITSDLTTPLAAVTAWTQLGVTGVGRVSARC